ncbi:MAG: RNase adapter RapZ, partial [Ruminococcus sp.]|nr:RNase adapter RapZ [Ruminococcus sp.]
VDIRTGDMFADVYTTLKSLRSELHEQLKVIYTEASDEILLRRYKETRRRHPLAERCSSLPEAIQLEREQLQPLQAIADYYIETSRLSTAQLGEEIREIFLDNTTDSMLIKVMSFGFKYGVSTESDLVFDVRCLPNPFYIEELRGHTGCEACVQDYVMSFEQSQTLLKKFEDLVDFLLPLYVHEGKSQLVIAFGCTGGKHRSITFAELMAKHLTDKQYRVQKYHRDITRDKKV